MGTTISFLTIADRDRFNSVVQHGAGLVTNAAVSTGVYIAGNAFANAVAANTSPSTDFLINKATVWAAFISAVMGLMFQGRGVALKEGNPVVNTLKGNALGTALIAGAALAFFGTTQTIENLESTFSEIQYQTTDCQNRDGLRLGCPE
ncbi:MAG: hypothetical protein GC136_09995 [Alphaproteobacteria bacterium]|nr:hypothetical protein [Alphaproteobacteria bacterium]